MRVDRYLIVSIFAVCVLTVFGWSAPAMAAAGDVVLYEGEFAASALTWQSEPDGTVRPQLPGTVYLEETGLPDLPCLDLLLLVPLDAAIASVVIEPLATHVVQVPGRLVAAMPTVSDSGDAVPHRRLADPVGVFPASWGEAAGSQFWRGYRLVSVRVNPIRALQGDDGSYTSVELLDRYRVRTVPAAQTPVLDVAVRERRVPGERLASESTLRQMIANPEALGGYLRADGVEVLDPHGFQPTRTPSLTGSAVSYLIITNEEMAAEFGRLAAHKTALGLPTVVATREWIAANFRNGSDIQETIRMFIRDAYQKWGTEYVLLGGDSDVLPPRYVTSDFYPANGTTDIPADLYFACLDGNWNANENAYYAEPYVDEDDRGDEADFAEEVYIGRAPVVGAAAAAVFVDKVITYETTPASDGWTNRSLFAAEVIFPEDYPDGDYIYLDGARYADQTVDDLIIPCTDMEYMRMYETDELYPADALLTRAALIDTLNAGHYGIVNQIGHGYYFNMSVGDANFMTTDADALVNGDHLFLIYAMNCSSGAFDYSCLLERFIQNPNGGSIVSIGAARAAFPNNSNYYQQEFWGALYCRGYSRVGHALARSRMPFLNSTPYNYTHRWTYLNYTLLGDPSLSIWAGNLASLTVTAPEALDAGEQVVTIQVSDGGSPVVDALVCLSKEDDDYAFGLTDDAGSVALPFTPTSAGEVLVKVTGRNLELTTQTIPVDAGTSYIALATMSIDDAMGTETFGNGNGEVDAGETVALHFEVLDTGGAGASGCTAYLSSDLDGVSILTATAEVGDVPAGGTQSGATPFIVAIADDISDGTTVDFDFLVEDDGEAAYQSEWSLTVKAPEAEAIELTWSDAEYGDGDEELDDNERIALTLYLKNFGAGTADSLTAVLRSDDPAVTLYDTLVTYADLLPMETDSGDALLSLAQADGSAGSLCRIVVNDNYGREFIHRFELQRPAMPDSIATDTSEGADVILLRWHPNMTDGTRGYHVYRSLAETGPFSRINTDLVEAVSYYRDDGLDQLTRYYYQISTVDTSLVESLPSAVIVQATSPAELAGFPVDFPEESSSHCAVGDVNGDGSLEIVFAADEVYVWTETGGEILDGDDQSQTNGPLTGIESCFEPAGVTLANLDGADGLEIIASQNDHLDATLLNEIHIYRADGTMLPGWPQQIADGAGKWNWATPAVGDVDGDGDPEIVVNALDGVTYVWHHDGSELIDGDNNPATNGVFATRNESWAYSSPALCDLDGDGAREIIVGTRATGTANNLLAYRADGTQSPGFPYATGTGQILCSPSVGDLDGDGTMEIVFYDRNAVLHVVREDGSIYPGFPLAYPDGISGEFPGPSPALGDLDYDGQLEIVWVSNVEGDRGDLMAVDTDIDGGTSGQIMPGWPLVLPANSESSPVLGDINGDGNVDILFGVGGGDAIAPDAIYVFNADGTPVEGFPISLDGPARGTPVICDLDRDGDVDIVHGSWGRLMHVWDMPFPYVRRNVPWPTFRGNVERDGVFTTMDLVSAPHEVPAAFTVESPFPNPFNPATNVRLYVPADQTGQGQLQLAVYDLQGRRVRILHDGAIAAGWHSWTWDGRDRQGRALASGLYFLRAQTGSHAVVHKMSLIK